MLLEEAAADIAVEVVGQVVVDVGNALFRLSAGQRASEGVGTGVEGQRRKIPGAQPSPASLPSSQRSSLGTPLGAFAPRSSKEWGMCSYVGESHEGVCQ